MKLQSGSYAAFRVIHINNLHIYLQRAAMHSVNHTPIDGLTWRATHNHTVQSRRATLPVAVGPRGTMLDYVPFHLGARNLFLYNLHTGQVHGYTEGQEPLITLVVSIDDVLQAGRPAVFFDGHAMDRFSQATLPTTTGRSSTERSFATQTRTASAASKPKCWSTSSRHGPA